MLEWYRLGWDDAKLIDEVGELLDSVLGPAPLQRHCYTDVVAGLDLDSPDNIAQSVLLDAGLRRLGDGRHVVTDYPADQAALARLRSGDPSCAARFEVVIDGVEIANGYWESIDAEELAARFEADRVRRRELGLPAVDIDPTFMAAMRAGLPDCAGVALGVDRLLMLRESYASLDPALPGWRADQLTD